MTYTVPAGRYGDYSTAFIQAYIDAKIAGVLDTAPETLDTLNELAAAIGDDPAYFATVAAQVSELNTDVTAAMSALGIAENDTDMGSFSSPVLPDASDIKAVLEAFAVAHTNAKTALEDGAAVLSGRIDALEVDPTTATAVAQVQADVDQNEIDSDAADLALSNRIDALEADPTTQTYVDNAVSALVDLAPGTLDTLNELAAAIGDDADFIGTMNAANTALSDRITVLEADPTTQTLLDAVQADVDQNELDGDAADSALSDRLDTLEADPTTKTYVDSADALKLNVANPAATGDLTVDTNARLQFDSNLTKVENVLRGTRIDIGNNIALYPAAAGGRVEIEGGLYIRLSDLEEHNNDTDAANAGIVVGGVYYDGNGHLKIRVS